MKSIIFCLNPSVRISILAFCLSLISLTGYTQLSGPYTIDPAGAPFDPVGIPFPNFASFSEAVDSLHAQGVSGAVVINVADGTYNEKISFNQISGASSTKRITFQSASLDSAKVILTFQNTSNTNNYTLRLNDADYVTIRCIHLQSTGITYARVININSTADYNIIENCYLEAKNCSSGNYAEVVASFDDKAQHNIFRNNYILKGTHGIYMEGDGLNDWSYGTQIINNTFEAQSEYGANLALHHSPVIENNTIHSALDNVIGIFAFLCNGELSISGNKIHLEDISNGGIYLTRCYGTSGEKGLIANNSITLGGSSAPAKGIHLGNSAYQQVYHNSVQITNTVVDNPSVSAFYQADNNNYVRSSNIVLKSNVFSNVGGGYAYMVNNIETVVESDYNDLFTTGTELAYWAAIGRTDLDHLRSGSGMEDHSITIDPGYVSNTDLHASNFWIDGAADPSTGITHDFEGDERLAAPDIGADQFDPSLFPLAGGTYTIGPASDYLEISDAIDDLNLLGIAGPVIFEIRDGFYNECVSRINQIMGASASDTIVLKSESGNTTIHFSTDELVNRTIINLLGTDHFTLMDLTISSTGTEFGRPIKVRGTCQNLNFLNNTIASNNTADNAMSIWGGVIKDITIKNNYFSKGRRNLMFYSNQDISYGSNALIEDNTFVDAQEVGIMMRYQISPIVRNNTVTNTNDANFYGIWARDCEQELEITGNIVSNESGGYGIRLGNCDAVLPFKGLIANNMVHVGGGAVNSYGMQIDDCMRQDIFYNSVHVTSADPNKGRAIYSEDDNEELSFINNIFANSGGGYAMFVNDPADISISDYNGFYAAGTNLARWQSADYTTLAGLSAVSDLDHQSLEVDPMFYSPSDLHTTQMEFHEAATPLSEVLVDLEGNARDAVEPDIGAVEFSCITPVFNVYIAPVCLGDTTMIIDSTEYIAPGSSRAWDLEGGDYAAEVYTENQYDTIFWVFESPGDNTINYIVKQIAGCNDFVALNAVVIPEPVLEIETKGAYCDSTDGWAEATVTNLPGPFLYAWSNGSTESRVEDLSLGEEISVAVRDEAAGCTARADTVIGEAIGLTITLLASSTCGNNDGSAVVSAAGGFEPYEFVWSNGYTTAQNDSLTPGPHYVNVIDNKGCYATGLINVESDGGPQISLVGSVNNDCYGETDGSLDISVTNGVAPYEILWSNGEISEDIDGLAAGIYNVVVEDAENCLGAGSFQVGQQSQISISTLISPATCEGSDGSAVALISGGTKPFVYTWSTGGHFEIEEGLAAGVYSLTILDGKGCEQVEPVIVSNVNAPVVTIDEVHGVGCVISDNGSIQVSVSPSNPFYDYSWSSGQTTKNIDNLTAGTYAVTVTNTEDGCSGLNQAVIEQEPPDVTPICIVSVDTLTGKNILIWVKENTEDVSHYNIYRESSIKGDYQLIDTVNIGSESSYIDIVADPAVRSWRYKISVVDVCGFESELSPHHKTMHLTMNHGVGGVVNLIWDHYEGFPVTTYKVWRYDAASNWVNITDMPSNLTSYTDLSPPNEDLTYFIEVLFPGGCEASDKKPARLNSSRSNRKSSKKSAGVGILEELMNISHFNIYPNPGEGIYKLELEQESLNMATIKVFDVSGKELLTKEYKEIRGRLETEIDLSLYTDGLYQVQIVAGSSILHRILIKE